MAADPSQVLEEIRRLAQSEVGLERAIAPSDELVKDLGLDSMTMTMLAVALEDHFRVTLSDEEALRITTVEELAALIARRSP